MSIVRYNVAGGTLRGTVGASKALVSVTETPTSGPTVVTTPTVKDAVVTRAVTSPAANNCRLSVLMPTGGAPFDFVSQTPSICTVDSAGNVARVSNGLGRISVVAPPHVLLFTRVISGASEITSEQFLSFATGSLAAHIDASIRTMVSGKTAGASSQAVLTAEAGGASAPAYTRNPALFTGALDLSAISVHTTAFGSDLFPVVLLSPMHLMAGHVGCSPGQQVVFKRPDGGYEVKTVVAQAKVAPDVGDNFVGLLDSPVTTIAPMKLLPSTWEAYLPTLTQTSYLSTLPVLNKGFASGDRIRILRALRVEGASPTKSLWLQPHPDTELAPWSSPIIGGDSNGPVFVPINGEAVLLHCMNFTTGGAMYPSELVAIQNAMNSLLPGYSPTFAGLSGFTQY